MAETSCSKVLRVTELLELILLALPVRDILLFQRVCQLWKSTITQSLKLQHALFMTAVRFTDKPIPDQPLIINPLLEPQLPFQQYIDIIYLHDELMLPASWLHPEASCKFMLLTTPATTSVLLHLVFTDWACPNLFSKKIVKNSNGVTMGDIISSTAGGAG